MTRREEIEHEALSGCGAETPKNATQGVVALNRPGVSLLWLENSLVQQARGVVLANWMITRLS